MSGPPLMGGELRRWRYFLVVAEELHMTRAANRLRIAQPSLSQQIRRLEADLNVQLIVRAPGGLRLTTVGASFAQDAAEALAVVDRAIAHARDLGQGMRGILRVGFISTAAAELTPSIMRAFTERYPDIHLQLRQFQFDDVYAGLLRELTDVAIVTGPLESADIRVETLFRQPRSILLPAGHRLAGRTDLDVAEIIAEPFVINRNGGPGVWREFWQADRYRRGESVRVGAEYGTIDEKFEQVGLGSGISLLPSSSARYYGRPGVVDMIVPQVEPCEVILIRRRDCDDQKVDAFVATAMLVAGARAREDLPPGQVLWAPRETDLTTA